MNVSNQRTNQKWRNDGAVGSHEIEQVKNQMTDLIQLIQQPLIFNELYKPKLIRTRDYFTVEYNQLIALPNID